MKLKICFEPIRSMLAICQFKVLEDIFRQNENGDYYFSCEVKNFDKTLSQKLI